MTGASCGFYQVIFVYNFTKISEKKNISPACNSTAVSTNYYFQPLVIPN